MVPNQLDANGLQVATQAELIATQTAALEGIYGADINLDSNSPDGQAMMAGTVQPTLDVEDLLVQINSQFDPDQAVGNVLDQRVAINGIQRQAGTFTTTNITIVANASCTIYDSNQSTNQPFIVQDNQGNQWVLQTTFAVPGPGTYVLGFQSTVPGAVLTVPNTIQTAVTIVLGIVSVNNPTTYSVLGLAEESDADLRLRRQKSTSLSSQGYLAGLLAALENIPGIAAAFVYENTTGSTDGDGIPSHSIWVIVSGSASAASIANAIYTKRNAGCGMKGSQTFNITQFDGSIFTVRWDVVSAQTLFTAFTASSLDGVNPPNLAAIQAGLVSSFDPGVDQQVNINELSTLVQDIDPNTLVTGAGFSAGLTQTLALSGVAASGTFVLNYNGNSTAAINWNDSVSTIQTKLRAVTGLTIANVTGSISSQSLVIDLSAVVNALSLVTVSSNTLETSGSAAITFTYNEGYTSTLTPSSKALQFAVESANIIMVPIILNPTAPSVAPAGTVQFSALGGYGAYKYSLPTNNSGGSINATSGLYTAGATGPVTDVVRVTDALGNVTNVNVTVT